MTFERWVMLGAVMVAALVLGGAVVRDSDTSTVTLEGRGWHVICHGFSPHLGEAVSVRNAEMIVMHNGRPIFVATANCRADRDPF